MAIYWDCTISHWSPADCESWLQIISSLSAWSVCRLWHCESSDSSVHPLIIFRVAWGGEVSTSHQLVTGVPQVSVLGPFFHYTTSMGHIIQAHIFSYHCYADDTQLISTNNSCTNLRLPSLSMDTRTSSAAQTGKDWVSCLPWNSNSTARFQHPAMFIINYRIKS